MKKLFFIPVFILFYFNSFCQSKYAIGFMASPDFTFINGGRLDKNYSTVPGYTFGFSIYKKLSRHFFLTTGVWYDRKGIKQSISMNFYDSHGKISETLPGTYYHKFQDIEIPLFINYTFGRSKLKFCTSAGVSFGFALKETITFESANGTSVHNVKDTRTQPDRINLCFSMGASYRFNERYSLLFEPNCKIDARAIAETLLDDSHSFGLRTTLIYKFKN